MRNLQKIYIPERFNYIAAFLTLNCNAKCAYCINTHGVRSRISENPLISGRRWVKGLNRLVCSKDLPITLQGGEPSLHPDFIWIINNIDSDLKVHVLTNLYFDAEKFIQEVNPTRLHRVAPYSSIRVSYHPDFMKLDTLIEKILKLKKAGFSIGAYGILHPKFCDNILEAQKKCQTFDIDFRLKEFLGEYNGKLYGVYRYPDAVSSDEKRKRLCRTSEFIIGPDCGIYRCHHDLYKGFAPIGNLLDPHFQVEDIFRECEQYGDCNPCDLKIKTNRFQAYGHVSVDIGSIGGLR